ncbi:AMP nucleosidase [Salmonella enterica subsp. enterica serovar Sendai]|nr:AMP nucleosidase [Salmonella enterica subsp. enterica serovar Sendai]
MENKGTNLTPEQALDRLEELYEQSVNALREAIADYVDNGTLLCVSDKPLHGEIKLPGQANRFYEGAISEHLQIGIRAIDLLRAEGDRLHSRKLRTFNEPPFR